MIKITLEDTDTQERVILKLKNGKETKWQYAMSYMGGAIYKMDKPLEPIQISGKTKLENYGDLIYSITKGVFKQVKYGEISKEAKKKDKDVDF